MEYTLYDNDEYQPLEQGNKYSPTWPFRMVVAGSSDSGKTTMLLNLLIGTKMVDKENGSRYILCNDVILIAKFPDEPKWNIVRDFFNELAETEDVSFKALPPSEIPDIDKFNPERSTIAIFEDLMHESKKIQEQIAKYFTHGRHRNISPIYVAQRFFAIYKTIRDNATYILIHRGGGSLFDLKNILNRYTEYSDHLVPIIDDLTMKKEFVVIDTRRSRDDPLSIRHMWDARTELLPKDSKAFSITKEKLEPKINKNLVNIVETRISDSSSSQSKFSIAGQEAISQAKKENCLVKFARNMPSPNKRKELLSEGIQAKNSDTWARLVYREAFNIKDKDLGAGWLDFIQKVKERAKLLQNNEISIPQVDESRPDKNSYFLRYKDLLDSRPLDEKKYIEGCEILTWLLSNGHIDKKIYRIGIKELEE